MGGDGGTKASNRRYMRGAGTADHTADSKRARSAELADAERERLRQTMSTCSVTGNPIDFRPAAAAAGVDRSAVNAADVVACPYGRLYGREAAVEALLRRVENGSSWGASASSCEDGAGELGRHIRGLKDLHVARFHVIRRDATNLGGGGGGGEYGKSDRYVAACPIIGVELVGSVPAYLIVRSKRDKKNKGGRDEADGSGEGEGSSDADEQPNVLSERAVREMGPSALQAEYGPFDEEDMIRLAPPNIGGVFESIKERLELRIEQERLAKKVGSCL